VSALIELGAGFHPEISGRENVYINGMMLGLTKRQMHERFDEIVAFADIEKFIDAPVKTYSSGMYMRLGFSVAISVDPDVLLVDEVLAVGDETFAHKCFDKLPICGDVGGRLCSSPMPSTSSRASVMRPCGSMRARCGRRVTQARRRRVLAGRRARGELDACFT